MTSKLLIGYPDIPIDAVMMSCSATVTEDEKWNLCTGRRSSVFRTDALASTLQIDFDLGSGVSQATNYLGIVHADWLQDVAVDMQMSISAYATLGGAATNVYTTPAVEDLTLQGPETKDFLTTWATSDAYRFWRLKLTNVGSTLFPIGKIYLGTYFDIGKDPTGYSYSYVDRGEGDLETSYGGKYFSKVAEPRLAIALQWDGITDAKAAEFMTTVLKNPKHDYFFLYSNGNDQILADTDLLYCQVIPEQCAVIKTNVPDYNIVTAAFVQQVL